MFQLTFAIFNGLSTGMAIFLVAAGLTLVFGVLRVMNFAHGAFFMVGAYVTMSIVGSGAPGPWDLLLGALVAAALVGFLGWLTDFTVLRRLMSADEHYVLIGTFALLMLVRGGVKLVWGVDFHSVSQPAALSGLSFVNGVPLPHYSILIMVAGVAVFLLLDVGLRKFWIGKVIQGIAGDRWIMGLMGYNVPALFTGAVVFAFALAGMAGALLLPNQGLSPELGDDFVILCFVVTIIGGLGSIRGAFVAAILLGLTDGLNAIFLPRFPGMGLYLLLIVVLLLRPQGLFGTLDQVSTAAMGQIRGALRRRRPASNPPISGYNTEAGNAISSSQPSLGRRSLALGLLFALVLAPIPFLAGPGQVFLIGIAVIQVVFALSWWLLFSYAGVASFGHAAFYAAGAYFTGWALKTSPDIPVIALLAGSAATAAIMAALVGFVALRRASGLHFAMLTMAMSEILRLFISYSPALGRDDGMSGIPRPTLIPGIGLDSDTSYFYYILAVACLIGAALWLLTKGRLGRALSCIAQDPERAAFIGLDVFRLRLLTFSVSAGIAAMAGSLLAPFAQIITPDAAGLHNSMAPILNTLLGGAGSFWGPVIGAFLFEGVDYLTKNLAGLSEVVVGVILLFIVIVAPQGITGQLQKLTKRSAGGDVSPLPTKTEARA